MNGNNALRLIWNLLFTLLYPVIITFSLVFFGITYLLSGLSSLIRRWFDKE